MLYFIEKCKSENIMLFFSAVRNFFKSCILQLFPRHLFS